MSQIEFLVYEAEKGIRTLVPSQVTTVGWQHPGHNIIRVTQAQDTDVLIVEDLHEFISRLAQFVAAIEMRQLERARAFAHPAPRLLN